MEFLKIFAEFLQMNRLIDSSKERNRINSGRHIDQKKSQPLKKPKERDHNQITSSVPHRSGTPPSRSRIPLPSKVRRLSDLNADIPKLPPKKTPNAGIRKSLSSLSGINSYYKTPRKPNFKERNKTKQKESILSTKPSNQKDEQDFSSSDLLERKENLSTNTRKSLLSSILNSTSSSGDGTFTKTQPLINSPFSASKKSQKNTKLAPATISVAPLTRNTNRIKFSEVDSDTELILKAVTKSQINQSPILGRLERTLNNLERSRHTTEGSINQNSDSDELNNDSLQKSKMIKSISEVETAVKNMAHIFGATDTSTTFLSKTNELKLFMNITKTVPQIKEIFDQLENEIKNIQIIKKLPKQINGASQEVGKRLKSMNQIDSNYHSLNFLGNEIDRFCSQTEQMSIYNLNKNKPKRNLNQIDDDDEILFEENSKLKTEFNKLQKKLVMKNRNPSEDCPLLSKEELLQQTKELLNSYNEESNSQIDETQIKLKRLYQKREKLISFYVGSNQQLKRLEIARKRMIDENAKIVTVKGQDYDLRTLDKEINSMFAQKEKVLKNLEILENKQNDEADLNDSV